MAGVADTARLIAELELRDKFSGAAGKITGSLSRMEGNFSRIGRGAGQVAGGLDRIGTRAALAAAGGLTAVIKTAADMEEAFVGIQKTVEETAAFSFEKLRSELRAMSSDTGTAFEELSRIGEIGGALGVGIEDLEDFIDVVNRLGVSTDLSTDAAATAIGQLRTILHLSGEEIRGFADDLVALGNAGASTEPEIVELAARFAAAGNRAGLTSGEILGLSSAVASMGINVEAGGTALSQTFNNIAKAIGTGSDDVKGFTEVLNISAKEFRTRWEQDALGTFQEFLRELSKLSPIAQATALDMAGITGQRQLNAVGLMADNWGFVGEQVAITKNNQEDLATESNKFFGTSAAGFRRLKENLRLTADTIGVQLLPIVNDLTKEFIDFLQLDSSQTGIKDFAKDLASGIRGLVTELKGTDFSGIIGGMKLAAQVAKTAFDAFRSLPEPIQQLAIAALVANKVSGGAIGQIAKGLGNIALGGGGLLGLGRTPASAMWVRSVGGPLGGPGGVAAGGRGFWKGVGAVFGIAAAVEIGNFIGKEAFFNPTVKPATDFESTEFQQFIESARGDPKRLAAGLAELEGGLDQLIGVNEDGRFLMELIAGDQVRLLDEQIATTKALLAETRSTPLGQFDPKNLGGVQPVKVTNPQDIGEKAFNEARAEQRRQFAALTLEQRLIKDNTFKQHLDAKEFIAILRKTSEFGRKGEGTTIEQGPKTGRDRFGDAFIALVERVKDPLTPAVYREVANHIIALEQVQRDLLREGNNKGVIHAQRNIDKMAAIIGAEDKTRSEIRAARADANQRTAAQTAKIAAQAEAMRSGFGRQNELQQEAIGVSRSILAKPSSLTAVVNVTTLLSVSDVQRRITSQQIAIGRGPLES